MFYFRVHHLIIGFMAVCPQRLKGYMTLNRTLWTRKCQTRQI